MRNCKHCGTSLEGRYTNVEYCDKKCRANAWYYRNQGKSPNENCIACGEYLTIGSRQQRYCSSFCQHLWRMYRIGKDEYNRMLTIQNGVCAICQNDNYGRNFHVDHCHTSNIIRGLLCQKCNLALGGFGDSIENLKRAIEYLSE